LRQPTKSLLVLLLASATGTITACSKPSAESTAPATSSAPTRSNGPAVDVAGMDQAIKPGDDFYAYANGGWMKATVIPPDRPVIASFTIVEEEVTKRTADLIQAAGKAKAAEGSPAGMVGAYYEAWMNEDAIEKRGLDPLKSELDAIAGINDGASLARVLGAGLRADVDSLNNTNFHTSRPLGLWVSPDFAHPDTNVGYLLQGGLGMPDRDNYLNTDAKAVELQGQYKAHIVALLKLAGIANAEARGGSIYDLEAKIAAVHGSRTDSTNVLKANNPWPLAEFSKRAPGLDWNAYFTAAGLSAQPMIMVWHPSATTGIAALAGKVPLDVWKDYLTFHAINRASPLLPKAYAAQAFHFYGTVLSGAEKPRDRWKRAVGAASEALGDAVGQLYVEKYFPASAKAECEAMVANIKAAFGRRIDALTWMSPATKEKAKAKVATLYVGVGYPDKWRDYAGLEIRRDDALGNAQRSELFDYRWSLAKIGQPVDKHEWWMTPQTVNAVNLPLQNAMNFPAAILNPPFFYPGGDPVRNYGAVGTVIGHEISHSFDDQGAQFDADGRLANWWTPEDLAHFQAVAAKLVAQYDAYEPLPGLHVNGKLTLSENIADVAGIAAAYDGYRSAYPKTAELDGFTGDQRFFIGFGQAWRTKERPESLRRQLMTDGHTPGEFRADTARNSDAWYAAFDVQPGQKLYLAPEDRIRVW
jgi:putative endopeptidase